MFQPGDLVRICVQWQSLTEGSSNLLIDDKVYFYWEHDLNLVGPMQSTPEPDKINSPRRQNEHSRFEKPHLVVQPPLSS
jgi:hypothetical protein